MPVDCNAHRRSRRLERLGVDVSHVEFREAVHLFITVDGQEVARDESVRLSREFLVA